MAKARSVARRTAEQRKMRRDELVKKLMARVRQLEEENDVLLRAYAALTGTPIEAAAPYASKTEEKLGVFLD